MINKERKRIREKHGPGVIFREEEAIVEERLGVALCYIWQSEPHWHEDIVEKYELVVGTAAVHVAGRVYILRHPGDTVTIRESRHHWAETLQGDRPVIVRVTSDPPWSRNDHHLLQAPAPQEVKEYVDLRIPRDDWDSIQYVVDRAKSHEELGQGIAYDVSLGLLTALDNMKTYVI